jgi:hypothetical protein
MFHHPGTVSQVVEHLFSRHEAGEDGHHPDKNFWTGASYAGRGRRPGDRQALLKLRIRLTNHMDVVRDADIDLSGPKSDYLLARSGVCSLSGCAL